MYLDMGSSNSPNQVGNLFVYLDLVSQLGLQMLSVSNLNSKDYLREILISDYHGTPNRLPLKIQRHLLLSNFLSF